MKQLYFRVNYESESGKLIYCDPTEKRNLINTIKLEIEKDGTQYNKFKKHYELEFLELTEHDNKIKLETIEKYKFEELKE